MFENVLAKFKVECTFKYLRAAEDNFIEKIREKNAVSFLHEKMFFHDATCKLSNKQEQLAKFHPFLKISIF